MKHKQQKCQMEITVSDLDKLSLSQCTCQLNIGKLITVLVIVTVYMSLFNLLPYCKCSNIHRLLEMGMGKNI